MLRRLVFVIAAAFAFLPAGAALAQEGPHITEHRFGFEGPFGTYDRAAVQRGFHVYQSVCASCHSMNGLAYRHLGEEGGPFAAYRQRNEETGAEEVTTAPHGEHARFVDPNENPYVRAIAAEVMIPTTDELGQPSERAGRPSDYFRHPFANEAAARASNGGALPPDLSVITSARHGGASYVRCILLGFRDPPAGVTLLTGQHYNTCFSGNRIAMAPPLTADGQVTYSDSTNATVDQMATDVATFLQWASDPHMEQRNSLGLQVLGFLLILTVLLYLAYRQVWRGTKH